MKPKFQPIPLALSAALVVGLALAQAPSANSILDKLEATQKNAKDYRARVVGTANTDDQNLKVDLEVQAIPSRKLTRVKFNAPDSLADNFIIVDDVEKKVYNYLFLTNQVTISSTSKATIANASGSFNLSQFSDFSSALPRDKVTIKVLDTETTPAGKTYVLEATPKANSDLEFGKAKLWVAETGWRPYRFQALSAKGAVQADLVVSEWKVNTGLTVAGLKALPKGAERINR